MTAFAWDDSYSVGVDVLDEQHRQLFEIVGRLDDAIGKNRGQREVAGVLRELAGYTQEHFAFEEKLMADAEFPGLRRHRDRHRRIIRRLELFEYELTVEGRRISRDVRGFLQHWLATHVAEEDRAYAGALGGRGVGA